MQNTLLNENLVDEAIRFLKEHEPPEGYYVAFSGGKDSICIYWLCKMAGVKFVANYHFTSIDPRGVPEFIRKYYPDVVIDKPMYKGKRTNFYELLSSKGLPLRGRRWCCRVLKEGGGEKGCSVVTGVREDESNNRKGRDRYGEYNGKKMVLPIYYWKTNDVWDFIKENNFPYPSLYDTGKKRLGCVLCPLACRKSRINDAEQYPERLTLIIKMFKIFLSNHPKAFCDKRTGDLDYDAEHIVKDWWINEAPIQSAKGKCLAEFSQEKLTDDE